FLIELHNCLFYAWKALPCLIREVGELQTLCGVFFLVMYMAALISNLIIITLTTLDLQLQTPMYFFLKNLSLLDVFFVSVPIPNFFMNSLTHNNSISILGCAVQVFLMTSFAAGELFVLSAMSYDRYVAICNPLHYDAMINGVTCFLMTCNTLTMSNITAITGFILMGFSDIQELQTLCGVFFLVMYMAALISNLIIITLTTFDLKLQTPMYFFLKMLSLLDVFFVSVPIPNFFMNSLTHNNSISIFACALQVFLMTSFSSGEVFILTAMSFDRYVAICLPLHYDVIMSGGTCVLMVGFPALKHLWSFIQVLELQKDGSCFRIHSVSLFLFIGELSPLILREINVQGWNIPSSAFCKAGFVDRLGLFMVSQISWTFCFMTFLDLVFSLTDKSISSIMYLVFSLGCTEYFLLAAMAYDRYLAICSPLHYQAIMNNLLSAQLAFCSWICGFLVISVPTALISTLSFCGPHAINHFFCDIAPWIALACTSTQAVETVAFVIAFVVILSSCLITLISYIYIISTILRIPSASGRSKAFSTCSSHLTVVLIWYGSTIFLHVRTSIKDDLELTKTVHVLNTVVTPVLNPFIYTLRNKEVRETLMKKWRRM
ncbi:hypothetical protein STEG23_023585, partial [Scotinomys teguina]